MRRWRKTNNGKRVANGCRNHGPCEYCRGNRTHANRKREESDREQIRQEEER